jgi:prepilin-type N-terminal cleavage/methylation domain-containing protein
MRRGFTLIEILVALLVMSILMLAFVRFFGSTLKATGSLQIQNELLNEGQLAQHLIVSRIKEAWYVWPEGAKLKLASSGWSTRNTLKGGHEWTVGKHFLAMILPPKEDGRDCSSDKAGCFRFFAYYPMKRKAYVRNASAVEALEPDAANDGKVWVLMEYRAHYKPGSNCPVTASKSPDPGNTAYRGKRGRLLVDYLQPLGDPWDPAYDYPSLFAFSGSAVTVTLRFAREARGRVYRVPAGTSPLGITAEPQNLGVKADPSRYYCR